MKRTDKKKLRNKQLAESVGIKVEDPVAHDDGWENWQGKHFLEVGDDCR
jgi:hypothetical protein